MYKIGLTGGIASGKSTVSNYLLSRGIPVVDADKIARALAEKGGAIWKAYTDRYGCQVVNPDGKLNRERLGQIIFYPVHVMQKTRLCLDINNVLHVCYLISTLLKFSCISICLMSLLLVSTL